ncbi:c6 zinc finger domain-containing protein, partial [Moniliophthora roreri]
MSFHNSFFDEIYLLFTCCSVFHVNLYLDLWIPTMPLSSLDLSISRTARIQNIEGDQHITGIQTKGQTLHMQVEAVTKEITRSDNRDNGDNIGEYEQCHIMDVDTRSKPQNGNGIKDSKHSSLAKPSIYMDPVPHLVTPLSLTIDTTSLRTFRHFIDLTAPSFCTNPRYMVQTAVFLPHLLFNNPVTMHAALAFTALHLGRLYESSSSSSSQKWITRASAHRNEAIQLLRHPPLNPHAHFMTLASLSLYTIALSLSSSSSLPENVFSLVTLLHNICSPLKQFVYAAPWLQGLDLGQLASSTAPSASDSTTWLLAPLHHLYETSTDFGLDLEELHDLNNREAYRTAVHGLCIAYLLSQTGHEARSAMFWPALAGK